MDFLPSGSLKGFRKRLCEKGFPGFISAVLPILSKLPLPTTSGNAFRTRVYTPLRTLWLFLFQVLSGNVSCDAVVNQAISWLQTLASSKISGNNGGHTKARCRLPLEMIGQAVSTLCERLPRQTSFHGFVVKIVDGTGISMADTEANRKAYPPHPSSRKCSGFPGLKLVGLFSLATGVLYDWATAVITTADSTVFRHLWPHLRRGDLILGDRHFCSFSTVSLLLAQGVHTLARRHQCRKHFSVLKTLGPGDQLVQWDRPVCRPPGVEPEDWRDVPEHLVLREVTRDISAKGFRTKQVIIVTTILDERIPADELAELYRDRWSVEVDLRHIKIVMGMDMLKCKDPIMVEKELGMFLFAYNLIRLIMEEAANSQGVPLEKLSFKSTMTAIQIWSPRFAMARSNEEYEGLWKEFLRVVGYPRLRNKPDRSEPRVKKRRAKNYQLLMGDRKDFRAIPHRNSYKKTPGRPIKKSPRKPQYASHIVRAMFGNYPPCP